MRRGRNRESVDQADRVSAAGIAGEPPVELQQLAVELPPQSQVGSIVGGVPFQLQRYLDCASLVGRDVEDQVESIDDRQCLIRLLAGKLSLGPLSGEHAGDLVLGEQGSVQLGSFDHQATQQICDLLGGGLVKDQRQHEAGVDDDARGYEPRCSSSSRASRTRAATSDVLAWRARRAAARSIRARCSVTRLSRRTGWLPSAATRARRACSSLQSRACSRTISLALISNQCTVCHLVVSETEGSEMRLRAHFGRRATLALEACP